MFKLMFLLLSILLILFTPLNHRLMIFMIYLIYYLLIFITFSLLILLVSN